MEFEHKVVCVTGVSKGIGRAIARAFQEEGALVFGIDLLQAETLMDTNFYQGDITDKQVRADFIDLVLKQGQGIDVFVNNAMVFERGLISDVSLEDFESILALGISAPYDFARLCKPFLNPGSSILNILSTRAYQSMPDSEAYAAVKGAMSAMTHAMAMSLGPKTRVNAIAPGWIDTLESNLTPSDLMQHPLHRVGTPEDIAKACLYLASDKAGFITAATLVVDGGMSKQMIYHGDHGWTFNPDV